MWQSIRASRRVIRGEFPWGYENVATEEGPMTLNKARMIHDIASTQGFTQKKASQVVETLLEICKITLQEGEPILISGFGKFCVNGRVRRRRDIGPRARSKDQDPTRGITFKSSPVLVSKINVVTGKK
jgi:integration host factor subunit alpha